MAEAEEGSLIGEQGGIGGSRGEGAPRGNERLAYPSLRCVGRCELYQFDSGRHAFNLQRRNMALYFRIGPGMCQVPTKPRCRRKASPATNRSVLPCESLMMTSPSMR